MIQKLFIVTALIVLSLSACNGQAPAETVTPTSTETQVVTATELPVTTETAAAPPTDVSVTETSATLPTVTATLGTPRPTNLPDCTNSASFVTDVTIPDNSSVGAGTAFTKTWRISNTGTCIWGPDYTLTHYSDEQMGVLAAVPLDVTFPGQSVDISVNLSAPNTNGPHRGNFVIKNPAGLIMRVNDDSRLWVIINVSSTGAATATVNAAATTITPGGSVTSTSTGPSPTDSDSGSANASCLYTIDRAKLTETINAVNAYRAQKSLPAYTVNVLLARAAQTHANDMACNKIFVHTGSDGSTPQSRVAAAGYVTTSMSENIYGSYPPLTGQGVVNWWINDKTDLRHNQNLLSNTFTEIGVGYSFFNNFGYYVLVFAKP